MSIVPTSMYQQTVTPTQAQAWLEFNFRNQRPLSNAHIKRLAVAMTDGRFTTNTIKFCMFNGQRYLVNGQHTLHAIVSSGCTLVLPAMDFECGTPDDLAALYSHEDINRPRRGGDLLRAYDMEEKTGLTHNNLTKLSGALKHIKMDFGAIPSAETRITPDDLVQWIPFYVWEMKQVLHLLTGTSKAAHAFMKKKGVLDIALITLRFAPEKAREFWRQVALDDGLGRLDPRKQLRDWLIIKSSRPDKAVFDQENHRPARISRISISAWNAFYEGRALHRMRPVGAEGPVKILGTYYSGNQAPGYLPLSASPNVNGNGNGNGHA